MKPSSREQPLSVLVIGCGTMGASHTRAYQHLDGFRVAGLVSRGESADQLAAQLGGGIATFHDPMEAIRVTAPDVVSINTYPDSHARIAMAALEANCHLFVEKPIAETVEEAQAIVALATERRRKVVVGYILRHHPSWAAFIERARTIGKPLVMRMNLNQQSSGAAWQGHRRLMESMSPIVDCGVHYVDIMCLMTGARPVRVSAIGARLSNEIDPRMYNYGQLQVVFDDHSVGWYEAGWGPMVSETAYFVKDVFGPGGSVSIVDKPPGQSANIDAHTATGGLTIHRPDLDDDGQFIHRDEIVDTSDEPTHDELCRLEQEYLYAAIRDDRDLTGDLDAAVESLRIVLAADQSVRTGRTVSLAEE